MKKFNINLIIVVLVSINCSCKKYLDVVPDNIATIDNSFTLRSKAEQYLFTCYSYLPTDGNRSTNAAMYGADEVWHYGTGQVIAKGNQSVSSPQNNYWEGTNSAKPLFEGIRTCNIFLDNVGKVEGLDNYERDRWIAEAKFLKAYYHFYLLRMYGPIPVIRENIPVNASLDELTPPREPIDVCVAYIVQLLDESLEFLPSKIQAENTELGRITQAINLAVKAKVLVMAASPLFNGNIEYSNFKNAQGIPFFNQTYDPQKWKIAADACKKAIDLCHTNGNKLYYYKDNDPNALLVSPETNLKMNIRNAIASKWNSETVWANPNSRTADLQIYSQPRLDGNAPGQSSLAGELAPTLKMAELFYSKNGVPISEDVTYDYNGRFNLRNAVNAERFYIKEGYQTVGLHFDREARFYADLGFDGGIWYGQGIITDVNNWYVQAKLGQPAGKNSAGKYSTTGYWPQKLVNPNSVYSATANYQVVDYPWPQIRLADLYLLYAEALNEAVGPDVPDVLTYIDLVRKRAGLPGVVESWSTYSNNPVKFTTKVGMRAIIHRERAIEMAFEGHRFWDLRRWKEAPQVLNAPIQGWDITQAEAVTYYRVLTLFSQTFRSRDYFFPISELELTINKKLIQNPGW
ncbi:hypothetical protein HDC92_001314 [Pedobacter sp. AK017]|uniref:RagB/SusD family nutrient uptake outer membrane protein n=1 Tax=Pedobacter sp. AK017 TaxID=2723073 RepID=UPI00161A638F|nr:RagB/SusD family nutrient uptake outer membrane protein [Pedobacter sp. AK017]MBB5437642.1 hypothetical protein [Pedobacter sp. AK017]